MTKFLFTDGTNGVQEVRSREDLEMLLASAPPQQVRIWIYPSGEWITLTRFRELYPAPAVAKANGSSSVAPQPSVPAAGRTVPVNHTNVRPEPPYTYPPRPQSKSLHLAWKLAMTVLFVSIGLLIYNFTRHRWTPDTDLSIQAQRPGNSPLVDIDSLISSIENARQVKLDKTTRTNLRIRNLWPDHILLKLNAARETSASGTRYSNIELTLDNATGYLLDEATAEISVWKNGNPEKTEAVEFSKINYTKPAKKLVEPVYVGDSISVRFLNIKSKAFNFCYAYDKQSNYGNLNDRWFCK